MRPNCHPASRGLTYLGLAAVVFTGFELGIRMAADAAGVWGIVAASVLFPVTITAAPLFALAVGHWIPALVGRILCARVWLKTRTKQSLRRVVSALLGH